MGAVLESKKEDIYEEITDLGSTELSFNSYDGGYRIYHHKRWHRGKYYPKLQAEGDIFSNVTSSDDKCDIHLLITD